MKNKLLFHFYLLTLQLDSILLEYTAPFLFLGTGITQWGQPGENHGEVRFLWSRSATDRLMISRQGFGSVTQGC